MSLIWLDGISVILLVLLLDERIAS
jgi:hypothetical protein